MQRVTEFLLNISLLISIPLLTVFYTILNNSNRGIYNLVTDIDRNTPFIKAFIIPYVIWYIFVFGIFMYLCIKDKKIYYKTLITYDLGMIACFIIYYFFQTTVPRPEIIGADFLSKAVSFIYSKDKPFNCFPSIHCLSSYIMLIAVCKIDSLKNKYKIITGVIAYLIILSTLFVKQHVILDALSAIILGDVIFKIVYGFEEVKFKLWKEKLFSLLMMRKKLEI